MAKSTTKSKKPIENDLPVYTVSSITTDQYAFLEDVYDPNPMATLNIDPIIIFEKNIRQLSVSVIVQIRIWQHDSNPFLVLEMTNNFGFIPEEWAKMDADNGFVLPKDLAIGFSLESLASARGFLHARLDETEISRFVLPSINVREVFKKDMVII